MKFNIFLIMMILVSSIVSGSLNIFSPETPPPIVTQYEFPWLYNENNTAKFNSTHLNLSIAESINDSHIKGDTPWLYDDFLYMYFNVSQLSYFLYVTGAYKTAIGPYLSNDTNNIYFDESKLNHTISQYVNNSNVWIKNSSGVYLKETLDNVTIAGNLNVTGSGYFGNNSVYIGNVKISQTGTGELNISDKVYSPHFVGEGSGLWNITFNETNGSLIINGPLTVSGNLNMTGNNITDLDCFIFVDGTIQCTAATQKNASGLYLWNDSTTIYFNETKLNETIIQIADIKSYEHDINVVVSGGIGSAVSISINYLITQIIVTSPSTPISYKFKAYETTSGLVIDENRRAHHGIWNIYKSHSINDTVTVNITNSNTNGNFTVKIKYIDNVIQV